MNIVVLQLGLVAVLVSFNALFAGSEMALVSLRDGQLRRLASEGSSGHALERLARDPNRYLATIQIGITVAGFLASASAAVSLARPLEAPLSFLGSAAGPVAIVIVTMVLSFVTLVLGELAPKRLAMQRAERWGLRAARPLTFLAWVTKPAVWLLARSSDLAVRLLGGDPSRQREDVTEEELRDLVAVQSCFSPEQRGIISGAFEISGRRLSEVLCPRTDVVVLDELDRSDEALARLLESGYSRAPVAPGADLDLVTGVVHLRDLVGQPGEVADRASPPLAFPESVNVLDALREMQASRRHLAVVVGEHGGVEGIVTVEDLLEELVGEIYDEFDRDVLAVERDDDGALVLPGRFPVHDLPDIGVVAPAGSYTTVAGLVLDALGRIPDAPGDRVTVDGWEVTVLAIEHRAITRVRLQPTTEVPSNEAMSSHGPTQRRR